MKKDSLSHIRLVFPTEIKITPEEETKARESLKDGNQNAIINFSHHPQDTIELFNFSQAITKTTIQNICKILGQNKLKSYKQLNDKIRMEELIENLITNNSNNQVEGNSQKIRKLPAYKEDLTIEEPPSNNSTLPTEIRQTGSN